MNIANEKPSNNKWTDDCASNKGDTAYQYIIVHSLPGFQEGKKVFNFSQGQDKGYTIKIIQYIRHKSRRLRFQVKELEIAYFRKMRDLLETRTKNVKGFFCTLPCLPGDFEIMGNL